MNKTRFSMRGRFPVLTRMAALAAAVGAVALAACADNSKPKTRPPADPRAFTPKLLHPALDGTIVSVATFADSEGVIVEGYGVVANLPNTGSADMPPPVREIVKEQLYRRGAGSRNIGTESYHPDTLLSSNRIAAVEVRGRMPALARKGTTFDIFITALPGSQTTSLERGVLWCADLKAIGLLDPNQRREDMADTRTIATGEGPVHCTPDLEPPTATPPKRNLRQARVIRGGVVQEDQPARLQLYAPSHRVSGAIQRAINSRWKGAASADNEAIVTLKIPAEFADNPMEFIETATHMYLAQEVPGFAERKASELIEAMKDPKAPHHEISLALQGLGRSILDTHLRPNYTSGSETVRFYTARAGSMMLDVSSLVVLQEFARTPKSRYQIDAINALASAATRGETAAATTTLLSLLDTNDLDVRIAAYHGLANMRSRAVSSGVVGRNFILDYVPSKGPSLIYATQAGQRRIALIGKPVFLQPGLLYVSRDNTLTVNALEGPDAGALTPASVTPETAPAGTMPDRKESVMLYYRGTRGEKAVTLKSPNSLAAVIARLGYMPNPHAKDFTPNTPFIGASYQQIIEMLAVLAKDDTLGAQFVLQKLPQPILSPSDLMTGSRPEKSVKEEAGSQPATQPEAASQPADLLPPQ